MASIFSYRCKCGRVYSVYLSKEMQYREMFDDPKMIEEGKRIDEEERKAGEVEDARRMIMEATGTKLRDTRINEIIQCECGEIFDALAFFREVREKAERRKKIEEFLRERMELKEDKDEKRKGN